MSRPRAALTGVRLGGRGLACALGEGLPACAKALAESQVNTVPIELNGLDEPVRMPFYRIPDQAELFDPERSQRLLRSVALEALGQAALSPAETAQIPLFVGSSAFSVTRSEGAYLASLTEGSGQALALSQVGFGSIAASLGSELGLHGPSVAFNTACTAAANALLAAFRCIALGRARHALVLGLEVANRTTLAGFSGLQLVADRLRPFDRRRSGIVLGEGVGAILLSAAEPGQPGLYLRSGASNCDTYSVTTANPDGSSIARVQRAALQLGGLAPSEVQAIKCHGTASPMNDTGEAAGIRQVFAAPPPVCALKPFIGHTLGACGVNELILFASALDQGRLPATPGFEEADPALGLSPLSTPSPAPAGHYLLNYFGFGGNNCSLLLEKR